MGVRGLQSYFEQECPQAYRKVDIVKCAKEHGLRYNCKPVLVVDGMALIHPMYSGKLEGVYGGQWLQYFNSLRDFIQRFENVGIQLVFFFDGTISSEKRKEWVRRCVDSYKKILDIFYDINANHRQPEKKYFLLPASMGTISRFALKELGAEVYQTVRDADQVIAEYAFSNDNVFAILSQDSDFIIYNTKPYFSLKSFDLNTLQTMLYDRDYFAHHLGLNTNQLPLIACLLGNDIISRETLCNFHFQFTRHPWIDKLMPSLVQLIHKKNWTGNITNQSELDNIAIEVFGHPCRSTLIRDGLKSYTVDSYPFFPKPSVSMAPSLQKEVFDRHVTCKNSPVIFNLLYNLEYESSQALEDACWLPSALIYRGIRQRSYGFIFNFMNTKHQNVQNMIIHEWCAYHGNLMERPDNINPLSDHCLDGIPSMQNVWFQCTEEEKISIFCSIFGTSLNYKILQKIPKHLIIFCCIINYLIGQNFRDPLLNPWEVAIFTAQAVYEKDVDMLQNLQVPWVDAKAVYLASVFIRGVATAMTVLGLCDYPLSLTYALPWHFFDGKLFHYLYVKTKEAPSIRQLCSQKGEILENFYGLLPLVTNNTRYAIERLDWVSYFADFEMERMAR